MVRRRLAYIKCIASVQQAKSPYRLDALKRAFACGVAFTQGICVIEYAEEYSKTEKFKLILLNLLWGLLGCIVAIKWYIPYLSWYVGTVHCHNPFGYSGISILWHFLFVGVPILSALIIGWFTIPIGYKGLLHKQFPPRDIKVLKPTKIQRGWQANLKSIFHLLIPISCVIFSIWGYFQIDQMPHEVPEDFDYNVCNS